jgi:hypothetical protein
MSETKHTPGPWVICRESDELGTIGMPVCRMEDDNAIVIGCPQDWGPTIDNLKADCRLIAAAPDLLEACKLSLPYLNYSADGSGDNDCEAIKAAIAKATE